MRNKFLCSSYTSYYVNWKSPYDTYPCWLGSMVANACELGRGWLKECRALSCGFVFAIWLNEETPFWSRKVLSCAIFLLTSRFCCSCYSFIAIASSYSRCTFSSSNGLALSLLTMYFRSSSRATSLILFSSCSLRPCNSKMILLTFSNMSLWFVLKNLSSSFCWSSCS